jgi:hypothetical protein
VTTGWYLYGITLSGSPTPELAEANAPSVHLVELFGLAAVVAPVRLADFDAAALRKRLENASALETMVRSHNRIVEAIHARQAILPAKFGMVYPDMEDVLTALRPAHDTLLHQLHRLQACDEWAVHCSADRALVRERIFMSDPSIRRQRDARDSARPGRAFFLDRQLDEELEAATEQALSTLAQSTFDRLASHAMAGQVSPASADAELAGEVEILRASFLVQRDGVERFHAELRCAADDTECMRCESSGPWPPYSFAARNEGEIA